MVWDVVAARCVATLEGHADGVTALAWLDAGRLASGSNDRSVKLWAQMLTDSGLRRFCDRQSEWSYMGQVQSANFPRCAWLVVTLSILPYCV